MRSNRIKRSAMLLSLALCLTAFAFPVTTSAAEKEPAYTYKTYEGKSTKKVTVTDAYKKTYPKNEFEMTAKVRIPKVTIKGVNTTSINKTIYNYCKAHTNKYCSCTYNYYVGKTYVSLIMIFEEEHDMSPATFYKIYNISRSSGKALSDKAMLKILGLSDKTFRAKVKKSIQNMYKKDIGYNSNSPEWIKSVYKQATSTKVINRAIPYVNYKGKISFLIPLLPSLGGAGQYDHCGPI